MKGEEPANGAADQQAVESERHELLARIVSWLETPMTVLGFVWLALLVIELTSELSPFLEKLGYAIWGLFVFEFVLELIISPRKGAYLRTNWLTTVSLLVPALRVFRAFRVLRIFRAARAVRGARLVRVISSLNRSMHALGAAMGRRGFGYVVALTVIVILAGSAGMYAFERDLPDGRTLDSYGEAVWWTTMLMTTIGSDFWPLSAEGRVLCIILSIYAIGVLGYVTATLASFFVGRDAEHGDGEIAGSRAVAELRGEILALRSEIRALRRE